MSMRVPKTLLRITLLEVLVCTSFASVGSAQTTRNREASVSPDGSTIAFVSNRSGRPDLFLMNADGTNQRNVTSSQSVDMGLAWSRDGRQIAFVSSRDGVRDIYLIGREGGVPQQLTHRGDLLTTPPAWSPDGTQIVFAAGTHQNADLYLMIVEPSGEKGARARLRQPGSAPPRVLVA